MAKSKKRHQQLLQKQSRKKASMNSHGTSRYARKASYCASHGVWGWQIPEPKPWGKD